jgi:hypothetical protein
MELKEEESLLKSPVIPEAKKKDNEAVYLHDKAWVV